MEIDFDADTIPELKHEPSRPVRPTVFREGIYVEAWKRVLERKPEYGDGTEHEMFCSILAHVKGSPQQSDATAAASFICWLGTNVGSTIVAQGAKLCELLDSDDGYYLSWCRQNVRRYGMNHWVRSIEHLVDNPTMRDLEVIDHVALWLGSIEGRTYLRDCEEEARATERRLQELRLIQARASIRAADLVREETRQ